MPDSPGDLPLLIRLFGCLEVHLHGQPLRPLRTRRGQWLLAILILRRSQPVDRAWLAGTLWPESDNRQGAESLRRTLTDLRQALGPEASRIVSPTAHTLALHLSEAEADVIRFDQAIARGDLASLEEALSFHRGPLVEGCHEEWLIPDRLAREEAYLTALETLTAQALARSDPGAAEGYLRRAVAADPLRENAQRALMQTLAARGSDGAALLVYRKLRSLLHRELHVEPDPETRALFEQLKIEAGRLPPGQPRTAPSLAAAPGSSPDPPEAFWESPALSRADESGALPPIPSEPRSPTSLARDVLQPPENREPDASARSMSRSTAGAGELPTAVLLDALIRSRIVGRAAELGELRRRVDAAR